MARQPSLKLNKERGEITNLKGEVVYVRRMRDGEQLYVARSTETPIRVQKQKVTEKVSVIYDGDRCTEAEDMTVEICVDFAVENLRSAKKPSEIESDVGDLYYRVHGSKLVLPRSPGIFLAFEVVATLPGADGRT